MNCVHGIRIDKDCDQCRIDIAADLASYDEKPKPRAMTPSPSVEMVEAAREWFDRAGVARDVLGRRVTSLAALLTETRTKALEEAAERVVGFERFYARCCPTGSEVDVCRGIAKHIRSLKAEGGEI